MKLSENALFASYIGQNECLSYLRPRITEGQRKRLYVCSDCKTKEKVSVDSRKYKLFVYIFDNSRLNWNRLRYPSFMECSHFIQ